ncbi:hypothetical protein AX16_002288 [Volvariella volvacea WC 439]|nr:hypothetical protein AX16_002288 [Volvariella volvacea WC 439]
MSKPQDRVEAVRSALSKAPPYCTGICELTEHGGHLYYRSEDDETGFVDLARARKAQLKSLAKACTPATFGRNNEDVYDETYRKARQMNTDYFSTKFDPFSTGIIDTVKQQLRGDREETIRAELYKLNVYGRGSFFKAHRDTPRHDTMFGSLVVVFPTSHKGGNLLLRHEGQEWVFDVQKLLADTTRPSVAFVAFYSDIEHEVELVTSGRRVTLTYNLYRGDSNDDSKRHAENAVSRVIDERKPDKELIRSTISSLLEVRAQILPNGGYLGFGLQHKYPLELPPSNEGSTPLTTLPLKGSDEVLWNVLENLSLKPSLRMFVDGTEFDVLVPSVPNLQWLSGIETSWECHFSDGAKVHKPTSDGNTTNSWGEESALGDEAKKIIWVTPFSRLTNVNGPYAAYGNDAQVNYFYAEACMIAQIEPPAAGVPKRKGEGKENQKKRRRK